jgi:hypothetical protein
MLRETRQLEGTLLHVQPRRPCNLQWMRAPGYIRHKTAHGDRTCCVLPMLSCVHHHRMCTTLGKFSRDSYFDRRRGLYIKEVQPQVGSKMPGASRFSKTGRYCVPSTLARRKQFSWRGNQPEPVPRGPWTAVATTTARPPSGRDVSVGAGRGSADPARTSTERLPLLPRPEGSLTV